MIGTNIPTVIFRARLEFVDKKKSRDRYKLTHWGGSKEFMPTLHLNGKGRADKATGVKPICIDFKPNYQSSKSSRPEMNLELKGLNISGVKNWLEFGKLTGYGYGEFSTSETYAKGGKRSNNYLYPYRDCAELFLFAVNEADPTDTTPTAIEWIVLGNGTRLQARNYLTMLMHGGFREALEQTPLQEYRDEDFSNI